MAYKKSEISEKLYAQHLQFIDGVNLTRRQVDVIACIVSGWNVKIIANILDISPRTVETHIDAIVKKLGIGGRNSIIEFVEKSGKDAQIREYYQLLRSDAEFVSEEMLSNTKNATVTSKFYGKKATTNVGKFAVTGVSIIVLTCLSLFYFRLDIKNLFMKHNTTTTSISSDLLVPDKSIILNRTNLLTAIDNKFNNTTEIQTVVIAGVGGAGKTTLARSYARQQKADVIWEINAETSESLINSFITLAYALAENKTDKTELKSIISTKEKAFKEKKIVIFVKQKLKSKRNWLLIYDNVKSVSSIRSYFPYRTDNWGNGRLIITTRDSNIGNSSYINNDMIIYLGTLSPKGQQELFMNILNPTDNWLMENKLSHKNEQFLQDIPAYPLDTLTAAYYLKDTKISFNKYLKHLYNHKSNFVARQKILVKEATEYAGTRGDIITLSLHKIIDKHHDFYELLLFISMLDTQNISKNLLKKYKNEIVVDELIHNLRKYSLITSETSDGSHFSIHRSTHRIAQTYLREKISSNTEKTLLSQMAKILSEHMFTVNEDEAANYRLFRPTVIHAEAFLNNATKLNKEVTAEFESVLGDLYSSLYEHSKALKLLEKHYKSGIFKNNPEQLAYILYSLGIAYKGIGDHAKMQEAFNKSLIMCNNLKAGDRKRIAFVLYVLGHTFKKNDDHVKSKQCLEKALKMHEKLYGTHNIRVAKIKQHLGALLNRLGLYKEAEEYLRQSLSFFNGLNDEKHNTRIANLYTFLSVTHKYKGDYLKAKDCAEKVISIYKGKFDEKDRWAFWVLVHLANTYEKLGNLDKTVSLLEKSILFQNKTSAHHLSMPWTKVHLGRAYSTLGQHLRGKELIEQGLKEYYEYYGSNHNYCSVAWAEAQLATAYKNLGEIKKARHFIDKSLTVYKNHYPSNHIRLILVLNNLAEIHIAEGNYDMAEKLLINNLKILEQANHNGKYTAKETLSDLYLKQALNTKSNLNNKSKYLSISHSYLKEALSELEAINKNSFHLKRIYNKIKFVKKI